MNIYQIEIIEPGAKRLLDDMAELELIAIRPLDDAESDVSALDRHAEIMSFSGTWSDMSETDFNEYLREAKSSGTEMLDRDVSL